MPDIDAWVGNVFPLAAWTDDIDAGVDTARLIAEKPSSIVVTRWSNGSDATLGAQPIRIEDLSRNPRFMRGEGGATAVLTLLIVGYRGHPTIADTDLQMGDEFVLNGTPYKVRMIVPGLTDSLQAYAEAMA